MSEREQLEQSIAGLEAQRAVLGEAVVDPAIAALREKLAALETLPASVPPARRTRGEEEQRKQVTILFADVSGFTAMSEAMDAEEVRDTMNALWTCLDGAITDHGGLIDKHIGDAVMALFGAPRAHEDDPERAIRAALAMQAALAAFREERQAELAMRVGINTGPVLLGQVGTTAEYTAMGDAVNLASRLEHAAPVGGILISHDTYRHVRGVFQVQPLEPIQVKGKTEPIQVYEVLRAKPRAFRVPTRGVEGVETRMIGREAELHQLQETLYTAIEDREAQIVTIVGEAGVGKSRLLYEFRTWLHLQPKDVLIFRGRATQEMGHLPYSLIRALFAFRFEILDSDPPAMAQEKLEQGIVALLGAEDAEGVEKAHFIGQLFGFDFSESPYLRGIIGDARQIHDRAFHYVAQFFTAVTGDSPTAIYLEDIHWADDGSLDLIDHLTRECHDVPLLIIALTRPELFERRPLWGGPSTNSGQAPSALLRAGEQAAHTRLELRPLSLEHSHRLVEEILQKVEEVPSDLGNLIVSGAEGNPFYVEEVIKMLLEDRVIVKDEDRWQVEMERLAEVRVPPTLTGVLQARLDGLPLFERETLQRASVIGRIFWDDAVEHIYESEDRQADETEIDAALQSLRGSELVFQRETSTFAGAREHIFKHTILRDVTYESVLKRLRRIYHAQVAAWLIGHSGERVGEYAGLIGEHYERAENGAQAAEWYGQAGTQAQETYALEAALDYYQRALELEKRWEWRKGQAEVLHILGRRDEEQAVLKTLEAAPEAPVFDVAYLWGQYHDAVGDYPQAQAAVEEALVACQEQTDIVGEVRCLDRLGFINWRQGQYDEAKVWYHRALALLQDKDTHSDEEAQALAQVLNGLGTAHRQQGQFDEAAACYERALALNRTSGDRMGEVRTLNNLGVTASYQRHFSEALRHHQRALDTRRAIGDRAGEGTSLYNLALVTRDMGDYSQAQVYLSTALTIHQTVGNRWEEVNVWNELGILYQELGDLSQAQACLQQGLKLSQEIGDEAGQAYILSNLGPVMRDQGDVEAADQLLTEGLALMKTQADKRGMSYFLSHLGLVTLLAGRLEQAIDYANAALTIRREIDLLPWTTADLTTLATAHLAAGDTTQALAYAQETLTILEECGGEGPECPQRDYFICYQVLSTAGKESEAYVALQSAYDLVMARADKITDPELRQSFLERVQVNRQIVQEYETVVRER